jgi:hypothetical protein
VGNTVEHGGRSDDVLPPAEDLSPGPFAEHGDGLQAWFEALAPEGPADDRHGAEDVENLLRRDGSRHPLGGRRAGQVHVGGLPGGGRFNRFDRCAPVVEVRQRHVDRHAALLVVVRERDQALPVGVRERLEHECVGHAEDGGARADPQRQRDDGCDNNSG